MGNKGQKGAQKGTERTMSPLHDEKFAEQTVCLCGGWSYGEARNHWAHACKNTHTFFQGQRNLTDYLQFLDYLLQFHHPQTQPNLCFFVSWMSQFLSWAFLFFQLIRFTTLPLQSLNHLLILPFTSVLAFCFSTTVTSPSVDYLPNPLTVLLTFHLYCHVTK